MVYVYPSESLNEVVTVPSIHTEEHQDTHTKINCYKPSAFGCVKI